MGNRILKYKGKRSFQGGGAIAFSKLAAYDKSKDPDYIAGQKRKAQDAKLEATEKDAANKKAIAQKKAIDDARKEKAKHMPSLDYLDGDGVLSTHRVINSKIRDLEKYGKSEIMNHDVDWLSSDGTLMLSNITSEAANLLTQGLAVDAGRKKAYDAITKGDGADGLTSIYNGRVRVYDSIDGKTKWVSALELITDKDKAKRYQQLTALQAIQGRDKEAPMSSDVYDQIGGLINGKNFIKSKVEVVTGQVNPDTNEVTYMVGNQKNLTRDEVLAAMDDFISTATTKSKSNTYNLDNAFTSVYDMVKGDARARDFLTSVVLTDAEARERIQKAANGELTYTKKDKDGKEVTTKITPEAQLEKERILALNRYTMLGSFTAHTTTYEKNLSGLATGSDKEADEKNQVVANELAGDMANRTYTFTPRFWSKEHEGDFLSASYQTFKTPTLSSKILSAQAKARAEADSGAEIKQTATLNDIPSEFLQELYTGEMMSTNGIPLTKLMDKNAVELLSNAVIDNPQDIRLAYIPVTTDGKPIQNFSDFLTAYKIAISGEYKKAKMSGKSMTTEQLRLKVLSNMYRPGEKKVSKNTLIYRQVINLMYTGDEKIPAISPNNKVRVLSNYPALTTAPFLMTNLLFKVNEGTHNEIIQKFATGDDALSQTPRFINVKKLLKGNAKETKQAEDMYTRYLNSHGVANVEGKSRYEWIDRAFDNSEMLSVPTMIPVNNYERIIARRGPTHSRRANNLAFKTAISLDELLSPLEQLAIDDVVKSQ